MNLLLDTHAFLWFSEDDTKLSSKAKSEIENPTNAVIVSIATLWEIAIKTSIHKLDLRRSLDDIIENLELNGIETLPITSEHILEVSQLPFHHRDPFDRILIAQALTENMTIVSNEKSFDT